jgi:predicted protein tyrosine phosphatase
MERRYAARLRAEHRGWLGETPVHVLDIPDEFEFMDPALVDLLEKRVGWHLEQL